MRRTSFFVGAQVTCAALGLSLAMCGESSVAPTEDPDAPDASTTGSDGSSEERDATVTPEDAGADARDAATPSDASDAADASDASDASSLDAGDAGTPGAIVQLAVGDDSACVLRGDGRVKCWGNANWLGYGLAFPENKGDGANEMGALLPFVDLGANRTAVSLWGGSYGYVRCAVLDTGGLKCWGANGSGNLGLGDTNVRGDGPNEMGDNLPFVALGTNRTAKMVSATNAHTCAILDDDRIKCWGNNGDGQLGLGDTQTRGDGPNEMGDNLPFVDIGAGRKPKTIQVANARTCIITDQDRVRCWGAGSNGQLGSGNGASRGGAPNQMGQNLPDVDLGTNRTAKAIAMGITHTCAILDDGTVKCWGNNPYGQLGLGDTNDRGDGPNEMGDALAVVPLGVGRTAKAIAAGSSHTCAILDDDSVKCWGENNQGQLGLGNTGRRGDGPNEMGNDLPAVPFGLGRKAVALSLGSSHSCALLGDGALKCWGYGNRGQLGLGDAQNRGDENNEMGDNLPAVSLGP